MRQFAILNMRLYIISTLFLHHLQDYSFYYYLHFTKFLYKRVAFIARYKESVNTLLDDFEYCIFLLYKHFKLKLSVEHLYKKCAIHSYI